MMKDLTQKSNDELKMMIVQLRIQLMENRFKAAQGELKETHLIKEIRRLIARVLTILHQRNVAMETKDYHHFNKILIEEQAKAATVTDTEKETHFLDKVKDKLGALKPKAKKLESEA